MIAITLIAAPQTLALSQWRALCQTALLAAGYRSPSMTQLSADEAVDVLVDADDRAATIIAVRSVVETTLSAYPVDIIVQAAEHRRKRLLVADMESTIIEQEMLEEMADALGKRAEVTEITRRAMNGELDFITALKQRVALFGGMPASLLDDMAHRMTLMAGAACLVATMRGHGAQCWLASGGFRFYTQKVAACLGFDRECANELLIEHGKLTGAVAEPVLDKNTKLAVLKKGAEELQIALHNTIAVGDGANDLAMLTASTDGGGLGIAFRAKPSVQAQAIHKINHGDLTGLLFAQGYKRSEFRGG